MPIPKKTVQADASCVLKTKYVYTGRKTRSYKREYVCSRMNRDELFHHSQSYLDIIGGKKLSKKEKDYLIRHTVQNFENFFNRGFIDYRKSVAEAEDYAALEWDGQGSIIRDLTGREFIDFLGGYGVYNMGIKHPKIVRAVCDQVHRMPLSSQELLDPLRAAFAEMLGELAPGDLQESFFINNGTDAVEGAMKLARLATGKPGFISTVGGFHGKSMGALSLMGKAEYRRPFEPLLDNVHFVPFGDATALADELKKLKTIGADIAAFVAEPVQGEAGAVVPPDDYFSNVRELCDAYGVLFIADEVQTGFGRTGKNFAVEHWGVVPDILCLGKAIGGGVMPLSCFMGSKKIWKVFEDHPFIHTTTFGGNPLACAAGIAAINVLLEEHLADQAAEKGEYVLKRLRELAVAYEEILKDVHGKGLLIGMDFVDSTTGYKVASEMFRRGVLVAGTLISARTIRIEPALNIPKKLLEQGLDRLEESLKAVVKRGR